jgi:hypothetical protein
LNHFPILEHPSKLPLSGPFDAAAGVPPRRKEHRRGSALTSPHHAALPPPPHSAIARSFRNHRSSSCRLLLHERLHARCHLRPPSAHGFTTTSYAPVPRTSTSSSTSPSTFGPCYRRRRPLAGPRHHGEPFPVSFRFPRSAGLPPGLP